MLDIHPAQRSAPVPPRPDGRVRAVIGFIVQRRAGSSSALRWALYRPDGSLSNSFAADLNRDGIAALLAEHGLTLGYDNTVVSIPKPLDPPEVVSARAAMLRFVRTPPAIAAIRGATA